MSIGFQSNYVEAFNTGSVHTFKGYPYTDGPASTILWLCKNTYMKLC